MRSFLDDLQQRPKPKGDSVYEAILANLKDIVSTPRGSSRAMMDLGIVDVTQIYCEYPDTLTRFQRDLLATVQAYEPRLRDAQILMSESTDLCLRFTIKGWFTDERGRNIAASYPMALREDNEVSG